MARRTEKAPPYEILRKGAHELRRPGPSPPGADRGADLGAGVPAEPGWPGAATPIVLRLPRGVAVLIGVALVGLIVLAYWVGYTRGASAAKNRAREQGAVTEDRTRSRAPQPPLYDPSAQDTADLTADPRQPDFNYLILARREFDPASELVRFLADRGVDAAVVRTDNPRFYHVIGGRSFDSEDWSGPLGQKYKAQMQEHGRAWKLHHRGRGDNLESMWWQKHKGNQTGTQHTESIDP